MRAMVRSPTSTETWPAAISIKAGTGAPSVVSSSPTGALCQEALLSNIPICASSRPSNKVRSRSWSSSASRTRMRSRVRRSRWNRLMAMKIASQPMPV